jgi:glycosyltransferase involved in cell wall biosynthesis
MKVVALTRTSAIGPSTRYRIEQYRAALAEQGIELVTLPLFGATWFSILEIRSWPLRLLCKALYTPLRLLARIGQCWRAAISDADLVLIEQQIFPYLPWGIESLLWPTSRRVIAEYDDAIFLTAGHDEKLRSLCARADLVIVGNDFLRAWAEPHARRVAVIPTTVDTAPPADPPRAPDGTLRVGWIGLPYNLRYLRALAGPLRRLAEQGIDCELRVISSRLPRAETCWEGVRLVHRPWSVESEREEIAACDVGVMPLPDDDWSRGKCALKLLQFMAAGRPVVASPVGVNLELIRDGENGWLAADEAAWESALKAVHEDRERAARIAAQGRRTVEEGYSLARGASLLAETYRQACTDD